MEPKNRKPEMVSKRKCDIGASKNAEQAFCTPRLSSPFLLDTISGFHFFSLSNYYFVFTVFIADHFDVAV